MATIESALIAHAVDLERAALGMAKGVQPSLDKIADHVRLVLSRYQELSGDKIQTIKDRDAIIREILEFMAAELYPWIGEFEEDLEKAVKNEIKFENAVLRNATGASLVVPTIEQTMKRVTAVPLVMNGESLSWDEYIGNYTPIQMDRVKKAVIAGWADGLTTTQISRSIVGTKTVKGILPASRREANMMAHDLTSHMSSIVKEEFGWRNQDVVVGEKIIVTLDSKTSPICQKLGSQDGGGKEYIYAEDGRNFPRPPLHRNCRSSVTYILAPEYREAAETRTRPAVVNGKAIQVAADTNWLDFAKAYPSVAESALGPARAKLINDMSADDFRRAAYNNLNQPLTLDEMAAKSKKVAAELKP